MVAFGTPFDRQEDAFDAYDEFVPANVPRPGPFLTGQAILTGDAHVAFHRLTRELFEERGVYDVTFGYNLARLNLDRDHVEAGFRYARETTPPDTGEDARVLRAEFTPTTQFCPQAETLAVAAFRAWNGLADRHEYDLVRVQVAPMHQQSQAINETLTELATSFQETGSVRPDLGGTAEPARADSTADADGLDAGF